MNNAAKLSILSILLPTTTHSSPVSTDNDLNSLVADLDPHPTPNINDILANLKAGLIQLNRHLPSFGESYLDVLSLFINEIEHKRLVDLSKILLNNLPL